MKLKAKHVFARVSILPIPEDPLSLVSPHPITWKGMSFKTVKHAYYAAMFKNNAPIMWDISSSETPAEARKIVQRNIDRVCPNWDSVKDGIMETLLKIKVRTHEDVYGYLKSTRGKRLTFMSSGDYYWGVGLKKIGENRLGRLYMQIRDN